MLKLLCKAKNTNSHISFTAISIRAKTEAYIEFFTNAETQKPSLKYRG